MKFEDLWLSEIALLKAHKLLYSFSHLKLINMTGHHKTAVLRGAAQVVHFGNELGVLESPPLFVESICIFVDISILPPRSFCRLVVFA